MSRATRAGVSRRDFNKGLLGAGAGLVSAATLAGTRSAMAEPVKGGRLRVAMASSGVNESLDPAKAILTLDGARVTALYNRLVSVSPTLEIVSELAESWDVNDKADLWTFKLRQGVTFHDGKSLTPGDVVYTFNRLRDEKTGSPGRALFTNITEVTADGTQAVRFRLAQANADFPAILADYHAQIVQDGVTDFSKAAGTGPFKLRSFEAGVNALVERNGDYWKPGLPYLDEVETFGIGDQVARTNALLAGDIELMEVLDPSLIERIKSSSDVEVISSKAGYHVHFLMLTDQAPYDDQDIRNALKFCVDRQKYLDLVYKGYGQIGNDHPISPADPFYCADIPIRQYDPEKAKFLLKKAGAEGMSFELNAAPAELGMLDGALVFADMAAKAGVNVQVRKWPSDGYWDNVWQKKAFCMGGWNMRPTADMMFSTAYASDAPYNDSHWRRPEFDKLLLEARATIDRARRKEIYCTMQRMIHEDGGVIIPVFPNLLDGGSKRVKGLEPHPLGSLGRWEWEKVYLEN